MHQPTDSVKIIRLVSGEEICCVLPKDQLEKKSSMLRLSEPMLIKYVPHVTQQGISDYIALVKWVGFTDDKIITIPKDKILTIATATAPFTKRYHVLVSSLSKQPQKLPSFVERDLNEEDYEELDRFSTEDKKKLKDSLDRFEEMFNMPSKKIH